MPWWSGMSIGAVLEIARLREQVARLEAQLLSARNVSSKDTRV